jgi:N-methylhydantoinase A
MLTTEFRHDFVRTYTSRLLTADRDELRVSFAAMSAEGEAILESEGVAPGDINHLLKMDLRYEGQIHEVELPIEEVDLNDKDLPEVHRKFHKRHADMYSYSTDEDPVENVNLRLSSVGKAWNVEVHRGELTTRDASVALKGRRPAYLSSSRTLVEMSVYDGSAIEPGMRLTGPAIVELPDTNIVVDDHFDLECDVFGNFVLDARAT